MSDEQFEWDDAKARRNLSKHGVSFEVACGTFDDVFAFERLDLDSESGEIRHVITGMVNGILMTAVYTEGGDRIRIISGRKATTHEEREYYRSQAAE